MIYPKPDVTGIVIESIFDSSVYKFIESDLDMARKKEIKNAYFEDGKAVVEYRCFENGDTENAVTRTATVTLD